MRRVVILFIAVLVGSLVSPFPGLFLAPAAAQTDPPTAELQFVDRINALRAEKGLGRLTVHEELVSVARGWSAEMARRDQISHNPDLADSVKADWQKLGENVGVGMTVEKLHDAFVASPSHYKNLVDPAFTHIGVGVVLGRDGAIFTAHQFMKLRSGASAAPPPATPTTVARRAPSTVPPAATPAGTAPAAPAATTTSAAPREPAVPPARLVLVLQQLRALDER